MTGDPVQVLLIGGSVRRPSYTRTLTAAVQAALGRRGAAGLLWDLGDRPLPIADPDFHGDPASHGDEDVRELVAHAAACDAFVLASPIYHNSYSGVLKNALDHLAIRQFQYKPVGLISHGGHCSPQAVDHLRIVARGLMGFAIPTQVCTAEADFRLAAPGRYEVADAGIGQRIERFSLELLLFAEQLRGLRGPRAS
jgi:azobenzene reductase